MARRFGRIALSATAALSLAGAVPATAKPPYVARPAPYRAEPRFGVGYVGSGTWRTTFHATPPNEGGDPDTNDARDSSTQAWLLAYAGALTVPRCGPGADGDACAAAGDIDGAVGATSAAGRIDHVHVDGIYRQLDRTERCRVGARTPADGAVDATLQIRYLPESRSFAFTALSPVEPVLLELPQACPNRADPIDRILDNYFMPGFSFDPTYGSERWFRSATVAIPARVFHHAAEIMVPLRDTAAGAPPRDCAVQHPEYERCRTGGTWNGVLIFRRG